MEHVECVLGQIGYEYRKKMIDNSTLPNFVLTGNRIQLDIPYTQNLLTQDLPQDTQILKVDRNCGPNAPILMQHNK